MVVKRVDAYSTQNTQRREKSFKTGAMIGAALSVTNDVFQHKNIKSKYKELAGHIGKNKAFAKIAGTLAFDLGAAMLFYGALNVFFGYLVDKVMNLGHKRVDS